LHIAKQEDIFVLWMNIKVTVLFRRVKIIKGVAGTSKIVKEAEIESLVLPEVQTVSADEKDPEVLLGSEMQASGQGKGGEECLIVLSVRIAAGFIL
jgi:hypothetical protein